MSTQSPKISIIVPVYKAEKYLHRCVDCILSQTFTDFELILVDDGSPDNSGVICDEYATKDNRIKVIHKENGGASDARNYALDIAKGELICFADSDDIVENNFLEIFNEKDADIVVQGFFRNDFYDGCDRTDRYVPIEEGFFDTNNVDKFIDVICKANNIGYLVTRAFKREIIERKHLRLNTEFKLREDQEFILRYMLECKTFATINKGAYHYDVPINFVIKYSHISATSNIECTLSIIENFEKIKKMSSQMLAENVNNLSVSLFHLYKTSNLDTDINKDYIKLYCKYYRECRKEKILSKKSHFIYYILCMHAPQYFHNIIKKLLLF